MFHHPQLDINCYDSPDILFQQLKNQTYDLLFTDIQMPTLNGFELLKKLRSLPYEQAHNIPVVALTARSDIDEQQFVAKGFAGCLHKPYSQKEVLQLIEDITGWTLAEAPLSSPPSAAALLHPEEDEFNFSALTAFSEGDAEASAEILRSFTEETQQNKNRLEDALKTGNCKQVKSIAHKLLPLLTMLEAKECLPLIIWLEREDYTELTAPVAQKINIVLQQMEKIIVAAKKRS